MSMKFAAPVRYLFTEVFKVIVLRTTAVIVNKRRSFQLNSILRKCWKCGAVDTKDLFCNNCNVLQKPNEKMNYFEMLGVKECYNLNESELSLKYHKLQNFLHPDRYTNKEKEEQQVSAQYSALVNKAYNTLSHPLQRGLYMLQMRGLKLEEGTVQDDPAFLTSIMELNEELDQAKDPQHVRNLDTANRLATEELTQEVANAFDKGDLTAAKRSLTKMKYYASMGVRIKELKQKLHIE